MFELHKQPMANGWKIQRKLGNYTFIMNTKINDIPSYNMKSMEKNTKFEKSRRQKLCDKDIQLTLNKPIEGEKKLNGLQFFAIPLLSHNASDWLI